MSLATLVAGEIIVAKQQLITLLQNDKLKACTSSSSMGHMLFLKIEIFLGATHIENIPAILVESPAIVSITFFEARLECL